ncbi:hypothetical protein CWATWH8502_3123 [Crocosphaera watsonii WH 8502]|uniref:Uncharacterized protein n=2 Tax=Crocosphaera watsonii TaxID=263511 RepID=T2JGE4_CROWT|nr:hypothetical protein CWATWH8502_3123 [Crocosphaera watsonii WH 8502]CCQ64196.1 hypothetical protein CWATWH0401_998 [Crocosphaera watsonii WH 0401]
MVKVPSISVAISLIFLSLFFTESKFILVKDIVIAMSLNNYLEKS